MNNSTLDSAELMPECTPRVIHPPMIRSASQAAERADQPSRSGNTAVASKKQHPVDARLGNIGQDTSIPLPICSDHVMTLAGQLRQTKVRRSAKIDP